MKNPTAESLAYQFSKVLRKWLTPIQLQAVIKRNASERYPNICHSHDFCDANMAMDEAWCMLFKRGFRVESKRDCAIWSQAWDIAKAAQFRI